jgi:predicted RNA binding protein YcfA (HicA-like mRNA interferase family)
MYVSRNIGDGNCLLHIAVLVVAQQRGGAMKVREAIRLIEDDGWVHIATRGSHRQFKHPIKPGRVTIAGKPSDDLARGTERSIMRQAGLEVDP